MKVLEAAKKKAEIMQKEQTLGRGVPTSANALEADLKNLKSDKESLLKYIRSIPLTSVESIFKKREVSADVLTTVLETMKTLESNEDKSWSADFLLSLAKADNFEMTLMFAEDSDKESVSQICSGLRDVDKTVCAEKAGKIETIYLR